MRDHGITHYIIHDYTYTAIIYRQYSVCRLWMLYGCIVYIQKHSYCGNLLLLFDDDNDDDDDDDDDNSGELPQQH